MHGRITVRMTDEMISRIDAWIALQPHYVSRQEFVRLCIERELKDSGRLPVTKEDRTKCAGDNPLRSTVA